jgi:hypothetical protein
MTKGVKKQRVLLVGLDYSDSVLGAASIDIKGLCRSEIAPERSAAALYDYDVIIINPLSYSHFMFGQKGPYSDSSKELWDLKRQDDHYDLDAAFDLQERQAELRAALKGGARVVWIMVQDKKIHFFGWRSLYQAYLSHVVEILASRGNIITKESKKLTVNRSSHPLAKYFEQVSHDGWTVCGSFREDQDYLVLASTPDDKLLGLELEVEGARAWMVTPPRSVKAVRRLIEVARDLPSEVDRKKYHGIFLSHSHADRPFVRKLTEALNKKGIKDVWVDEAEILVGDSLIQKIEEGLKKTRYFGVVLSPRSVGSPWVKKELEAAMNKELKTGSVVVLPLLYEHCDLPPFLEGKLYADFTAPSHFDESIDKLLRKLAFSKS